MMRKLSRALPVFLLLLLPLFLFPGAAFRGQVVSANDHLSVHAVFQETPGGAVRNPALSDPAVQFRAFRQRVLSALRGGHAPLWNPDVYAGAPLLGNGQSRPFSPVTLLHLLLPEVHAQNLGVWWLLWWPALGSFLLLRRLGLSPLAALCGGVACMNLPYLQVWLLHPHASTYVWLPWLLWSVERLGARGPPVGLALCTLGLMSGGHPETAFHALLIAAAWSFWRQRQWRILVGIGVGLLASAAIWLPILENIWNSATLDAHGGNRLALAQLMDLLWPNVHGHPALEGYRGPGAWADGVLSPGIACIVFALLASKRRLGRSLLLASGLCLFLAVLGPPLANHARLASIGMLFFALASAFGVARLSHRAQCLALVAILSTGAAARRHDQGSVDRSVHSKPPATWALNLAKEAGIDSRVVGLGSALQPNTAALAGLRDLRGYDLPVSRDWERFAAELDARLKRPDFEVASFQPRNAGAMSFAGVGYLVSEDPIDGLESVLTGPAPVTVSIPTEPGHRAWLAEGAKVANSQEMAIRTMVRDKLARARPPLEGLERGWPGRSIQPLKVEEKRPEDIRVAFSAEETSVLVLADAWSPGWTVEIDGVDRPLLRAGGYFKAVVVQAGEHEARFVYRPWGWVWGTRISWVGVFLLGALVSLRLRNRRNPAI